MEQSPSWAADSYSATWKFLAFYGTQNFIIVFTRNRNCSLSWTRFIHSTPSQPISLRSTRILSSHVYLGLPSCLFPSGFQTKIIYAFIISPMRAACSAHLILDLLILIIFWCSLRLMKFLVVKSSPASCHFLPLSSKYSPQHPVLRHPQSVFFP